jgi:hypothetical protein
MCKKLLMLLIFNISENNWKTFLRTRELQSLLLLLLLLSQAVW